MIMLSCLTHTREQSCSTSTSTFTDSCFQLPPTSTLATVEDTLISLTFTNSEVYKVLSSLDVSKAVGCDHISPIVLKCCADILAEPLTTVYNLTMNNSQLPKEWKVHKIRPIPKSGDKLNVNNYRPISLLCIPSKVLEKVIYDKVITFIRPKLSKCQFGFLTACLSFLSIFQKSFQTLKGKPPYL